VRVGIPREVKDGEARVGATPDGVRVLAGAGHEVLVERGAGSRAGFPDDAYREAGARIAPGPDEVWTAGLVVKVKELQAEEWPRLRPGCVVAAYHQLARDPRLLDAVLGAGIACLAWEGVTAPGGARPLLAPMSEIAGRMTAQIAAWALQSRPGPLCGSGVLLCGAAGVPPGRALVVGEGAVGKAAAGALLAVGCEVTVLGRDPEALQALEARHASPHLRTGLSTPETLAAATAAADVVVGAVSVLGRLAPKLVTRAMLRAMRPGSVIVDVGIDMGGIAETSRQTKLSDPLFVEEGVLHYGVPNIPALVPRAATQALAAATLPVVLLLAGRGIAGALRATPGLRDGLLVHGGRVIHPGLAEDTGRPCAPFPFPPEAS